MREFARQLLMFCPGYRKAFFLEQKLEQRCAELKAAIDAARPVDRTDEVLAAIDAARPVDRTDEVLAAIDAARPVDHTEELKATIDAARPVDRTDEVLAAIAAAKPIDHTEELRAAIDAARPVDRTDEVLAAIDAAKPVDRTDEMKAIADRNLHEYHEHLNNAQAEVLAAADRNLHEYHEHLNNAQAELRPLLINLFKDNIRCRWQVLDALDDLLFPPTAPVKCLVCGHEAPKSTYETRTSECIFGGGRLERFVCPECGCIFGPLKMMALDDGQLSSEYSQHYHVYCEGDSKWKEIAAFHALHPRKEGRYLNFGAGAWSKSTIELRAEGWDVYDYEPYAPEDASEWVLRSYNQLQDLKFDGIFSNDVLEHFEDPVAALSRMKTILRNGGIMAHCTGCYEYAYEYTRFHYAFFTGNSLGVLADKCGLRAELGGRMKESEPARICIFTNSR